MPDAGDSQSNQCHGNHGWSDRFAALPQATPDPGGWQRVQARLPAPAASPVRARWPLWLATAASLVLALAIPLRMLPLAKPDAPAPTAQQSTRPALAPSTPAPPPRPAVPAPATDARPASVPVANRDNPRRANRGAPSQQPIRTLAAPADTPHLAAATDAAAATDLEPLYAQSAQLESLLAMARDERVASGTSAALSDGLDARVAGIDAALIQPGLTDAQRADLWDRRVDALQQLVGIEATNRLYAARGQRYDAALVSID